MSLPATMSASASRSAWRRIVPVGLCGVFTTIMRVFGVTAAATASHGTL